MWGCAAPAHLEQSHLASSCGPWTAGAEPPWRINNPLQGFASLCTTATPEKAPPRARGAARPVCASLRDGEEAAQVLGREVRRRPGSRRRFWAAQRPLSLAECSGHSAGRRRGAGPPLTCDRQHPVHPEAAPRAGGVQEARDPRPLRHPKPPRLDLTGCSPPSVPRLRRQQVRDPRAPFCSGHSASISGLRGSGS